MPLITCEDCGHHRQTTHSNTRYCRVCRLLRDLEFMDRGRDQTCRACEKPFPGIRRGDRYCGSCALGITAQRGRCNICQLEDAYLVVPEVAVCESCARSAAKRPSIVRGLRNKVAERRSNPPAPLEENHASDAHPAHPVGAAPAAASI